MKYIVTGVVTISVQVELDADSEAQAREKADDAPMQQLCNYCASGEDGTWSTGGELDGTPQIESVKLIGRAKVKRGR